MEKILIIDDDEDIAELESYVLKKEGYETVIKYTGEEALEEIDTNNYDLILMDIMMPNMNGETTLEELKKDSSFDTPVIALTADAVSGAKERYMSEGFVDYISKPFSREQIKEKLDVIFSSRAKDDRFSDAPIHVFGSKSSR